MTQTLAIGGRLSGLLSQPRSTAKSESAEKLILIREGIRQHLLASYTVRREAERALDELAQVQSEAARSGWNGYQAKPVTLWACVHAKLFIEALPTTAPAPEVSADPDGDVALDWVFGRRKALSVSIGPTGRCTFAWMLGHRTYRGTDWLNDGIPETISRALAELARD